MPVLLHVIGAILLAAAPAAAAPGPTLAREDTLHTSMPEVLVHAPRVTLDEILNRIARAERRRDSLLVDESFIVTTRMAGASDSRSAPHLISERVAQVYRKKPNHARTIELRRWSDRPHKHVNVEVSFRADMSEQIVNFAFRPEARRDFRYRILGRDLVGGHVIYRIRFDPKSPLDPMQPSGIVWVDTNDFVIIRQEIEFDRSPVPLLIRDVDRMVIERERVQDFWMLHRVLMRARFNFAMPHVGRQLDLAMQFENYALNQGLPDSLFTTGNHE